MCLWNSRSVLLLLSCAYESFIVRFSWLLVLEAPKKNFVQFVYYKCKTLQLNTSGQLNSFIDGENVLRACELLPGTIP